MTGRKRKGAANGRPLVAERHLDPVLGEADVGREQRRVDLAVGHRLQVLVDEPFEARALAALLGQRHPAGRFAGRGARRKA